MELRLDTRPRQQIFHLQAAVLSSLDRAAAERSQQVFEQAWANRLWMTIPMLPTRPATAWRNASSLKDRQELQNTYQTAAFAFDLGIPRCLLAPQLRNFTQFTMLAREAVRHFDLRIGPPWWVHGRNRAFLESMYTAIMAQEELASQDEMECVGAYLGEVDDLTMWQADSFMDYVHGEQSDIIRQCEIHYYEQPRWLPEEQRYEFPERSRLKLNRDPLEAQISMLLNWQVLFQPRFAFDGTDQPGSYRAKTAFPHRAEERRLMRLLSLQPRGRPQR
jgi:hypothetical protein